MPINAALPSISRIKVEGFFVGFGGKAYRVRCRLYIRRHEVYSTAHDPVWMTLGYYSPHSSNSRFPLLAVSRSLLIRASAARCHSLLKVNWPLYRALLPASRRVIFAEGM